MNASMILRAGLALALAAVAQVFQPLDTSQVSGRVLLNQGKTQVAGTNGNAAGLRSNAPLLIGDVLKTADGDAAALSLTPGIAAWLPERSELKVEALHMSERGEGVEERFAQVRLERGEAIFSVGSPEDRQVDLRVLLPSIEAGAEPGSAFSVSFLADGGGVRVLCAAGAVHWRDDARAQSGWVLSGQFQDCGAGAPSVPNAISSDGAAQVTALALLNTERILSQLQSQLPSGLIPRAVKSESGEFLIK